MQECVFVVHLVLTRINTTIGGLKSQLLYIEYEQEFLNTCENGIDVQLNDLDETGLRLLCDGSDDRPAEQRAASQHCNGATTRRCGRTQHSASGKLKESRKICDNRKGYKLWKILNQGKGVGLGGP